MRKSYLTVLKNQLRRGRLLWPIRQALKWPAHRLGAELGRPLAGPVHGTFFTTYACNLRCGFCDLPYRHIEYRKGGRKELGLEEKLRVVDDFSAIGTTAIGFTGGEPLLDPATPSLIRRAADLGILTHLSSNGYAFQSRERTAELFDLGLHATSISIDGVRPETHNAIRNSPKSYEQVIIALNNLLDVRRDHPNRMSVTTTTVITRDNYREVPDLVERLIDMGVDQIGFLPVQDIGLDYDVEVRSDEFMVRQADDLDRVVDYLIEQKRKTGRIENTVEYLELFKEAFRGKPLPIRCYAGHVTLAVDSWGDIYPCFPWAEMRRSAGNVRKTPLAEFWRSQACGRMRAEAHGCRECYWNNHTELNLMMSRKRVEVGGDYTRYDFSQPVPDPLIRHIHPVSEHV